MSSKRLAPKAVCQALISARVITADQARDLIRRERQVRDAILAKAGERI